MWAREPAGTFHPWRTHSLTHSFYSHSGQGRERETRLKGCICRRWAVLYSYSSPLEHTLIIRLIGFDSLPRTLQVIELTWRCYRLYCVILDRSNIWKPRLDLLIHIWNVSHPILNHLNSFCFVFSVTLPLSGCPVKCVEVNINVSLGKIFHSDSFSFSSRVEIFVERRMNYRGAAKVNISNFFAQVKTKKVEK